MQSVQFKKLSECKRAMTIIVGAGIAGLWLADYLLAHGDDVLVLERNERIGGRIWTSKDGFEIGAGRIQTTHVRAGALVDTFGLKKIPLAHGSWWMDSDTRTLKKNPFDALWDAIGPRISQLSPDILASHTLRELLVQILGQMGADDILLKFPYRGEVDVMRADVALRALGFNTGTFYVVREGLSAIVDGLAARIGHSRIQTGVDVVRVVQNKNTWSVITRSGHTRTTTRLVLAIPVDALRLLVREMVPKHLQSAPLIRIYARFPHIDWLKGRIVTDSPLRYIIPVRPDNGLVMISYTDGRDAEGWIHLLEKDGKDVLTRRIQTEVSKLFPDAPKPIWVRAYPWKEGCTYWGPKSTPAQLNPRPGLFLCGESLSSEHQAWVEGALETAESVADAILNRARLD